MDESLAFRVFGQITDKQKEALDVAAEGLTSKQVALQLDLAPRSVDRRIDAVRSKIQFIPRNDLLRLYRRWKKTCEETTCDPFPLTVPQPAREERSEQPNADLIFRDASVLDDRASWERFGGWSQPGIKPSELKPWGKVLAVIIVAFFLLISFALIVATAEGVDRLSSTLS